MRQLSREDIVGRRIGGVLQTPWEVKDGWSTCRTFVTLSGGVAFELEGRAVLETSPIYEVDLAPLRLIPAFAEDSGCDGDAVLEVVASDMWPTFGLLLSSRRFLLATAYADGVYGPVLSKEGEFYLLQDAVTYWGHGALTGEVFFGAR